MVKLPSGWAAAASGQVKMAAMIAQPNRITKRRYRIRSSVLLGSQLVERLTGDRSLQRVEVGIERERLLQEGDRPGAVAGAGRDHPGVIVEQGVLSAEGERGLRGRRCLGVLPGLVLCPGERIGPVDVLADGIFMGRQIERVGDLAVVVVAKEGKLAV